MEKQRTAILTGAYGAIGKAIAEGMAAKGCRLVMIGRNQEALRQARAVLSAHPGDVRSKLSISLGYGGWESPDQGAATPLYCATDPGMKGITGQYVANKRNEACQFSRDHHAVETLYEICSRY